MPDTAERPRTLQGTVGGSTYVKPAHMDWKPTRFDVSGQTANQVIDWAKQELEGIRR